MKRRIISEIQPHINIERRQQLQNSQHPRHLQQRQQKQQTVPRARPVEKTQPLAILAPAYILQQKQRMAHRRHQPREAQHGEFRDHPAGKGTALLAPKIRILMKNQTAQAHKCRTFIERLQPPHHDHRPQRLAAAKPRRKRKQNRHAP